jgi:hypothetical protein
MLNALKVCAAVAVAGMFLTATETSEARPQYRTVFQKHYTKVVEVNKTITCFVCHSKNADGKLDPKTRNIYGQAVMGGIKKEGGNEKDLELIKAALIGAEKGSNGNGKTFGEILQAGQLPVPAE